MLLVDGEPQIEELKLAIVSIEHIPARGALLASTTHILAEAVEGGALLGIALGVIAVGITNIGLQGRHPVDLVGGLEGHRDHR